MPLLKKITSSHYNVRMLSEYEFNSSYDGTPNPAEPHFIQTYGNKTNTALIEDQDQSVLYIDGRPHDSTSLVPIFDKTPVAFKKNSEDIHSMFTNNALLTNNPVNKVMWASEYNNQQHYNDLFHNFYDDGKYNNLDSQQGGAYRSFTIQGKKVTFFLTKDPAPGFASPSSYAFVYDGKYSTVNMVIGDDFSNPEATVSYNFDLINTYYYPVVSFLHFDIDNQTIYFSYVASYSTYTAASADRFYTGVLALQFKVPQLDGEASFTPYTDALMTSQGNLADFNDVYNTIYSFCGYDNYDNLVFQELYNDSSTYPHSSGSAYIAYRVVNYSSGAPSVVRTYQPTLPWAYDDAWSPANNSVGNPVATQFFNLGGSEYASVLPLFSSNEFAPVLVTWDKALDASLATTDFVSIQHWTPDNINYPLQVSGSSNYYLPTLLSAVRAQNFQGFQFTSADKLIHTELNNEHYLTLFTNYKCDFILTQATQLNDKATSLICYRIDDIANPLSSLTFVNSVEIRSLDYYLTDSNSTINAITPEGIAFFSLTPTGWVKTSLEPGIFNTMSYDSFGRIWATKMVAKNPSNWIKEFDIQGGQSSAYDPGLELHMIVKTLAYTTSIEFAIKDQEYAGVTLNNTLKVNAYDELGQRIQTSVLISIQGSNMAFDDGSTSKSVQTSTVQDTSVPVLIQGPGYINVTASFNI